VNFDASVSPRCSESALRLHRRLFCGRDYESLRPELQVDLVEQRHADGSRSPRAGLPRDDHVTTRSRSIEDCSLEQQWGRDADLAGRKRVVMQRCVRCERVNKRCNRERSAVEKAGQSGRLPCRPVGVRV
jgi:hypothetical protein